MGKTENEVRVMFLFAFVLVIVVMAVTGVYVGGVVALIIVVIGWQSMEDYWRHKSNR